jgi:hypothetical protein
LLFELTFSKTILGNLRVTTLAIPSTEYVLSIYNDDKAFISLLGNSGLDRMTVESMESSVHAAFGGAKMATREVVELTNHQLQILRLGTAQSFSRKACYGT